MSYYLSVANQESITPWPYSMHSQSALIRSQSHLDLIHDTAHQESLISHLELIRVTGNVKISHLHLFHFTAIQKSLTLTLFMSKSIYEKISNLDFIHVTVHQKSLTLTLFMAYSIIQKSLISHLDLIYVTVHEKITHLDLTHNIDHRESLTLTLLIA